MHRNMLGCPEAAWEGAEEGPAQGEVCGGGEASQPIRAATPGKSHPETENKGLRRGD